jgi:hypothetical protein
MTGKSSTGVRLLAGVLALTALGISAARAQEGVAVKNLLGSIGLINPDRDPIAYRERAPLVLPPKVDLREPAAPGSHRASSQWPKDPDVMARRAKEADGRIPVTQSEIRRMSENNPRMSVDELRAGRTSSGKPLGGPVIRRGDNARDELLMTPDQLRSQGVLQEEANLADGEPIRRTLTDPPSGMRKSASGNPVQKSFGPRPADAQVQQASPLAYILEQAGIKKDEE